MSTINYIFCLQKNRNNKSRLIELIKYFKSLEYIPLPNTIELGGEESPHLINGWDLPYIKESANEEESILTLKNSDIGFNFSLVFSYPKIDIRINKTLYHGNNNFLNIEIIKKIIVHFDGAFNYIECSDIDTSIKIHEEHIEFTQWSRTFLSSQLEWLQYYNHDELKRQGGDAILENPYIKAERLCGGILVQVGESLEEAYSPEGQELLVKATKAMPPVQKI